MLGRVRSNPTPAATSSSTKTKAVIHWRSFIWIGFKHLLSEALTFPRYRGYTLRGMAHRNRRIKTSPVADEVLIATAQRQTTAHSLIAAAARRMLAAFFAGVGKIFLLVLAITLLVAMPQGVCSNLVRCFAKGRVFGATICPTLVS